MKSRKFIVCIAMIVIIIVSTACETQNKKNEPEKIDNNKIQTEQPGKIDDDTVQTEEPVKGEDYTEKVFTVGESVTLNNVVITFNGVKTSKGEKLIKPHKGNIFVLPSFTIENKSEDKLSISSLMSFDVYQDGYSTSLSISALVAKKKEKQLDGSIEPGKKMKGVVGYEVPKKFKELEIKVKLRALSNEKITFVYKK